MLAQTASAGRTISKRARPLISRSLDLQRCYNFWIAITCIISQISMQAEVGAALGL